MKILAIIPARGGSKGVPGKNIKPLNGKPLLYYTSEIALKCKNIHTVALSSDDDLIINCAVKAGIEVPYKRPQEFATDNSPTIDSVKHMLEFYLNQNVIFDAVCLLQVTSPFRTVSFVENAIQKFIDQKTDSLVSVQKVPAEYNPHWTFEENPEGFLKISTGEEKIISRRQDLPTAYFRDGQIYITKTNVILDQNSLYGKSISYIVSSPEFFVNIDTMDDWEKAELISKRFS